MANDTDIEWCDDSTNPVMGCDGCELWLETGDPDTEVKICYAGVLHERYGGVNAGFAPTFRQVTEFPGRVAKSVARSDLRGQARAKKPWLDGLPRLIFVSDMGDALSQAVGFEFLKREIIDNFTSAKGHRHVGLWLTKQARRMAEFAGWLERVHRQPWPQNLWVGTSVTSRKSLPRLGYLSAIKGAHRFVSLEPLWENVDLSPWLNGWRCKACGREMCHRFIPPDEGDPMCTGCRSTDVERGASLFEWAILGGQSGVKREFDLRVARSIRDQCKGRCAFFLKQLGIQPVNVPGAAPLTVTKKGGAWEEWPQDLRVREMPKAMRQSSLLAAEGRV